MCPSISLFPVFLGEVTAGAGPSPWHTAGAESSQAPTTTSAELLSHYGESQVSHSCNLTFPTAKANPNWYHFPP